MKPDPAPENASRLRGDIDSGRTGDKVPFPDPAASPLGTDSEAGGAPPDRHAVGQAGRSEMPEQRPPQPNVSDESGRTMSGDMKERLFGGLGVPLAIVGGVAVLAIVVAILIT